MSDEILHLLSEFFVGLNQPRMTTLTPIEVLLELIVVIIC